MLSVRENTGQPPVGDVLSHWITLANPVSDLTYIWGKGGGMSVAADGLLKSLGSGRLCPAGPWLSRRKGWATCWL